MDTLTKKQKHQGKDEEGENSLEALWGESHGTHACPQKHHYQEALPRLLPSHYWQWIPASSGLISTTQVFLWPVCHSAAPSSLFCRLCSVPLLWPVSALSLSLSRSLCEEAAVGPGSWLCRALWWGWGAEVSLRLKVWIALRCLAASFGSKFEGLRSAHTLGKETTF